LCVQLGGAVGNGATLGTHRLAVEQALAQHLGLEACGHSWHTQRDSWMRLAMEVAVCCGSLSKLARDWSLMSQYEVAEISEAARGSTSSAMPHKRNPVHCMQAVAQTQAVPPLAALLLGCMAQAHERALGEWQAEVAHWPELWRHAHGAAAALRQAAQTLQVHPQRMLAHVAGLRGLVFSEACVHALAPFTGKHEALAAVEQLAPLALEQQRELQELLMQWAASRTAPELPPEQLPALRRRPALPAPGAH
jgi:3-carboxy-cis,cis-muconate cycloisomerase